MNSHLVKITENVYTQLKECQEQNEKLEEVIKSIKKSQYYLAKDAAEARRKASDMEHKAMCLTRSIDILCGRCGVEIGCGFSNRDMQKTLEKYRVEYDS